MSNPFRAFLLRPKLLGSIIVVVVLAAILPLASLSVRLLVGWCVGVLIYVAMIFARAFSEPHDRLRHDASRLDDSALVITLFAIIATAASVGAVAMIVFGERSGHTGEHLALAAATMACA